jgi:hypothetical protein
MVGIWGTWRETGISACKCMNWGVIKCGENLWCLYWEF